MMPLDRWSPGSGSLVKASSASRFCAAIEAGCDRLYSEDLSAGQHIGGLKIVSPLA